MTALPPLSINPGLDTTALASRYREEGRVRITRFLVSGAPELYYHLEEIDDWVQVISHESGAHEISRRTWDEPASLEKLRLEPEIYERARDGFQYSYAALRIPAEGETCEDAVVRDVSRALADPSMLSVLAAITGVASPTFVDGQITAYGTGDFLTGHDDDVAGSRRKAAFVLGLTPQWRPEWGGLLLFHEPETTECLALVPRFNTLDLFTVPTYHSVSQVTRAAARRRYSITGWLADS